jgi:hypothetical protein
LTQLTMALQLLSEKPAKVVTGPKESPRCLAQDAADAHEP